MLPGVIDSQVHFREPGLDAQGGPRDGLARRGARRRHRGVRDAQHRSADDDRGGARRQGEARERPDALRLRLLGRRDARQCRRHRRARAPARRGGDQGVHGLLDRQAAGRRRRGRAGDPEGDRAGAPPSTARTRRASTSAKPLRVAGDPASHPVWRDETAALRSTERLVRLAREAHAQVHVLHISTREEMALLAEAKDVASCEATPHHLTLERRGLSRGSARTCR